MLRGQLNLKSCQKRKKMFIFEQTKKKSKTNKLNGSNF